MGFLRAKKFPFPLVFRDICTIKIPYNIFGSSNLGGKGKNEKSTSFFPTSLL